MTPASLPVERPVLSIVLSLLLIVLGIGALLRLPVREYPDVDPPVVSVATTYPGASASVVERDVTDVVEENLGGVEGVDQIVSTSRDQFSQIDIEFEQGRDLDAAAADVRDRVSAVRNDLPDGIDPPVISKASADAQAMMWFTLTSESRDRRMLTDFAERNLVDPLSVVPGVAQVVVGGARRFALRIWLDPERMAARGITVSDVTAVLRSENLELPAGRLTTPGREITLRTDTKLTGVDAFRDLVIRDGESYQVRLEDIARIELGAESYRSALYESGREAVGLGVVRQSGSNTLAVADAVKAELEDLQAVVPSDVSIKLSYDQSIFIEGSIREVVKTLAITAALVVAVIFLFLGSLRTVAAPAATIPVALVAAFTVLLAFGFSINTLTLLALVLAVGLVVDDTIVVVENVTRHHEEGEPRLLAAVNGLREIGFAVIGTTLVLISVLVPIAFMSGTVGRLFTEFAAALAAAVGFSSLVALTLGATLSSRLVEAKGGEGRAGPLRAFSRGLDWVEGRYAAVVDALVGAAWLAAGIAVLLGIAAYFLLQALPQELAPTEDRGVIIVPIETPESSNIAGTIAVVEQVERILEPYGGEGGPVETTIAIVGPGRQGPPLVDQALMIVKLRPWGERDRSQQALVREIRAKIGAVPGARAIAINPPSLVSEGFDEPVQFVIGGPDYRTTAAWARQVVEQARERTNLSNLQIDYREQSWQADLRVDRQLAADLGVDAEDIGQSLQILFGGQDVTEFYEDDATYEVMVRAAAGFRDNLDDLQNVYLRDGGDRLVPLSAFVTAEIAGVAPELIRVDRLPSTTISGIPEQGSDLGAELETLRRIAEEQLPPEARISYRGLSKEFMQQSSGLYVTFLLALVIVYLVLAALFESFLLPLPIMLTVPLAVAGPLAALLLFGFSLNTFSQIALLLVVGLLAKNAILVVDFANDRRQAGLEVREAVVTAARTRFRPIVMTSIATLFGAVPLILATGPGAESRSVMGVVIVAGTLTATLITLLIVPGLYRIVAGRVAVPGRAARSLADQRRQARPGE